MYTKKLHLLSSSNGQAFILPKIIRTGIHRCEGTGVRKTEMATQYRKAYVPVTLDIEQFVHRVKRNSTLTELTPYALRELVKAVYVWKHLTSPAASADRRYILSTTLWATFPWMNC